jgi:hypothetical protein
MTGQSNSRKKAEAPVVGQLPESRFFGIAIESGLETDSSIENAYDVILVS